MVERTIPQIAEAENGDAKAGRELLSMISLQLRKFGKIEPALARYLADKLDAVSRSPASEAARLLNISENVPASRPPDEERREQMFLAVGVAQEVLSARTYPGNLGLLRDEIEDEVKCANDLEDLREREEELKSCFAEFIDQYYDLCSKEANMDVYFDLAARIFNRNLQAAQEAGQRLHEKPTNKTAIKGAYYRVKKEKEE